MTITLDFLLGVPAEDATAALRDLVRESLGVEADGPGVISVVDYACDSPATGGLYRVNGRTTDGADWSLFCKLLQHVRHWPKLTSLPEHLRADFCAQLPWRAELQLWEPAQLDTMPAGLRAPHLHRLIELDDDRLALWQEDVPHDHGSWDLERFGRAAHLLGRWNARSTAPEALAVVGDLPPGYALRMYAQNAVTYRGLGPLRDEELWTHPWLAPHADLRAALLALGPRIDEFLDLLDGLPQCAPHGDASPQNLLAPPGTEEFIAIDVSFRASHALGFDLGQLVLGLVHADLIPASDLPAISDVVLDQYCAGLRAEGIPDRDAARGFAIAALLRSGFDGFRYDLLQADPDDSGARRAFDQRILMSRFLVDQVGRHV